MEGGSEPHASIRMVRAEVAHGEPIFFLGATDTKNRLDAGKHCRTWIEVDVPPAEALKYQSRVDIALIRSASRDETMAVIPEELIDRVSLNPNTLPTEAEARDGVQAMSEMNMCRFWAVPKDRTRQQWFPTICLSMQRAVGFGTRNAQRRTGQRRSTGRAAVMYTPSYQLAITIFDKEDRPVPVRAITYISRDDEGCKSRDLGHGPMFAMASRPPPKLQTNDSTSRMHLGWGLATAATQLVDSFGEGSTRYSSWNSGAHSGTTTTASDTEGTKGRSHGEGNVESRARSDAPTLNPAVATNSGAASTHGGEAAAAALDGQVHGIGIVASGVAGANALEIPNDGSGTSGVRVDSRFSDAGGGSSVGLSTERGSGAKATAATKPSQPNYVHVRVDINASDFVSVLTRPRPGPCALDVLRALPAASSAADANLLRVHGSMDPTTDGSAKPAALVGSTMAGSSSGWASIAGTRALEDATKQQQHGVSGSSATSLNINGMRDST